MHQYVDLTCLEKEEKPSCHKPLAYLPYYSRSSYTLAQRLRQTRGTPKQ